MSRTERPSRASVNANVLPDQADIDKANAAEAAKAEEKKTRKPVDVGVVTIGVSTRTIVKERKSKLDTDPVAVAVRDAAQGANYDIAFEPGKSKAIVSVLRRAGGYFKRGVNILDVNDTDNVITFSVGDRKVRKTKPKPVVSPDAPSTEDAQPEQWAGPTHEAPQE